MPSNWDLNVRFATRLYFQCAICALLDGARINYWTAHNKRRGILVEFAKNRTVIELEWYWVKSHEPFGTLHVL